MLDMAGSINGALRVSSVNQRYFTDDSGKAVYLTGSHTWGVLQDSGFKGTPPSKFDYAGFLDLMQQNNHNFFRFWMFEGWCASKNYPHYAPMPYKRTGPGTAIDGGLKYDLDVAGYPETNNFNQAYFDRMRERILQAGERGIYAAVMLFQGWSVDQFFTNPWPGHPYHKDNNINSVNGDYSGNGNGADIRKIHTDHPMGQRILAIQEAYIRKVVDTVHDLDNVLYEIINEDSCHAIDWQYHMIDYIKAYESGKLKQHPVGMTGGDINRGANNEQLYKSRADWISPLPSFGANYTDNPTAAAGEKVILIDTDHINLSPIFCTGGDAVWVWKCFMRGLNPIYMDDMNANEHNYRPGAFSDIQWARPAMGDTRLLANRIDLVAMTPQNALSSTQYCLANEGMEYLILKPDSNISFSVRLSKGLYSAEWWSLVNRISVPADDVISQGQDIEFTVPFSGAAVLYLKQVNPTDREVSA